jgi:hypothetical protein
MNSKLHQSIKVKAAIYKKGAPRPDYPARGRIIRSPGYSAQGADNPAPREIFLTVAATFNSIDRGRQSYNIVHRRGKQHLEG